MLAQIGGGGNSSRDPLDGVDGTATVANPYHYADNDPLNKTDPTGMRPTDLNFDDPCFPDWDSDPNYMGSRTSDDLEWMGERFETTDPFANYCHQLPRSKQPGYRGVTPDVVGMCGTNPLDCSKFMDASVAAFRLHDRAVREKGWTPVDSSPKGQEGDAMLHLVLSYLLGSFVQDGTLPRVEAESMMYLHERTVPEGPLENQQDRANNYYGMELARVRRLPPPRDENDVYRVLVGFIENGNACLLTPNGEGFRNRDLCGAYPYTRGIPGGPVLYT